MAHTKSRTVAVIDGVGDGIADDTAAIQTAIDAAYVVVQNDAEKVYRVTAPLKSPAKTILLNVRIVMDFADPDAVMLDWADKSTAGVYYFGGEIVTKSRQGTVALRLPLNKTNAPQECFLAMVSTPGFKVREREGVTEMYTFP